MCTLAGKQLHACAYMCSSCPTASISHAYDSCQTALHCEYVHGAHVMAQNQKVTQPTQTSSRRLQMPTSTAMNIIQMLNSVSDSQPVDYVMMSPDAQSGLDADATLVETPLAETLNDDGAAVVDSGGDVQAAKGLL